MNQNQNDSDEDYQIVDDIQYPFKRGENSYYYNSINNQEDLYSNFKIYNNENSKKREYIIKHMFSK